MITLFFEGSNHFLKFIQRNMCFFFRSALLIKLRSFNNQVLYKKMPKQQRPVESLIDYISFEFYRRHEV